VKLYTAHVAPNDRLPVMVPDGLSLRVLVFGWVGLILHGAWMPGFLAGAATIGLHLLAVPAGIAFAVTASLHLGLAAFTPEIRRWDLRTRGFRACDVIAAPNRDSALLRFMDLFSTRHAQGAL